MLYCSPNLGNEKKHWIIEECEKFHSHCHLPHREWRKMFLLVPDKNATSYIPPFLADIHRAEAVSEVVSEIVSTLKSGTKSLLQSKTDQIARLESNLEQALRTSNDAFEVYGHGRFWKTFSDNADLHIFTCARDAEFETGGGRGRGGRTNIDKWDFQSVLDITHYFASHHPTTKVTIEDPVSKLLDVEPFDAGEFSATATEKLRDKDCIIIGSPDVSDFAELALAKVHNLKGYRAKQGISYRQVRRQDGALVPSRSSQCPP